jgi:hypothetical protein
VEQHNQQRMSIALFYFGSRRRKWGFGTAKPGFELDARRNGRYAG